MPQLTEDINTEEGKAVIAENERYEGIKLGKGRKVIDAETQTPQIYVKSMGTYIGRVKRTNHATFVNNWVLYDTYLNNEKDLLVKVDGEIPKPVSRKFLPIFENKLSA